MMEIMFARKQVIITFLTLFINALACGQVTFSGGGSGTEADPYVLLTKADWNAFAESVNAKENPKTYEGEYLRLGKDITGIDVMVGWFTGGAFASGNEFRGNFDGDWHTLTVDIQGTADYSGPFGWVDGATIRNLTVDGTITINKSGKHGGGIVSCAEDREADGRPTNIINCTSKVTISCNDINEGYHGGLVGWLYSGGLNFENCIFEGSMTGNTNNCAGFVGEIDNNIYSKSVSYTNCTQAHWEIAHTASTVFATFHLPTNFAPQIPEGQRSGWETAYYTHKIGNDGQGTLAYCASKPIPVHYNKILKHYIREHTGDDKEFYVPAAVVTGINGTDIYTDPVIPTVTYYGRELVYGKDFTTSISKEGKTSNVTVSAKSGGDYYGSETFTGINVQSISTWAELKALLDNNSQTRHITLNKDYIAGAKDEALFVDGTVILRMNGHTIDRHLFELPDDYYPYTDIENFSERGQSYGYVMKVRKNANLTIYGKGVIKGGCSIGNGGGINSEGNLTLEDITITENFCRRQGPQGPQYGTGAGVYSEGTGKTLTINKCRIIRNVGDGGGGGINAQKTTLVVKESIISENRVNSKAGGIRINTAGAVIKDCNIENNVVKNQGALAQDHSDGGGILLEGGTGITFDNCKINNNSCAWKGGGIQVDAGSTTVKNSIIKYNSALGEDTGSQTTESGGGGIFLSNGTIKLIDCIVEENSSYTVGGVYCENSGLSVEGKTRIVENIGDAKKANVFLAKSYGRITISGPLDESAKIGLSRDAAGQITSGLKGKGGKNNFNSDNYQYYWVKINKSGEAGLDASKILSELKPNDEYIDFNTEPVQIYAPLIVDRDLDLSYAKAIDFGDDNDGALFIQEGCQFIYRGEPVKVHVLKNIQQATKQAENKADVYGWYTISSPVSKVYLSGENIGVNLVTSVVAPYNFDLLQYNEATSQWEPYVAHTSDFKKMEDGRGYLYRNANNITIQYKGMTQSGDVIYTLSNSSTAVGGKLRGWNLIGNPFTFNIYKGEKNCAIDNGDLLTEGFYCLTKSGSWEAKKDGIAIKLGEGILVKAKDAGTLVIENTNAKALKERYNNEHIAFTVANSSYEDVTYAMFKEGSGLPKINHRNEEIPMIYITHEGEDYAIATLGDETKSFNLSFKAKTTGQYTLSYKTEGVFDYLHVIDCFTGRDIDMLADGEYTFIGSPQDKENRFIVRLQYKPDYGSSEGVFAYQNGNDVLVSGEGELQVYDAMGRMVLNRRINGVETINLNANGVYILKLIGEEILTQKMVVR